MVTMVKGARCIICYYRRFTTAAPDTHAHTHTPHTHTWTRTYTHTLMFDSLLSPLLYYTHQDRAELSKVEKKGKERCWTWKESGRKDVCFFMLFMNWQNCLMFCVTWLVCRFIHLSKHASIHPSVRPSIPSIQSSFLLCTHPSLLTLDPSLSPLLSLPPDISSEQLIAVIFSEVCSSQNTFKIQSLSFSLSLFFLSLFLFPHLSITLALIKFFSDPLCSSLIQVLSYFFQVCTSYTFQSIC